VPNSKKTSEFEEACKKVTEYLLSLTDEEFAAELEKHKDGDIAQIIRREMERWEEYNNDQRNSKIS
jgi:hypothetical protein